MSLTNSSSWSRIARQAAIGAAVILSLAYLPDAAFAADNAASQAAPAPLLTQGHPVDWWFVFKFNAKSFAACGDATTEQRQCIFGGTPQTQHYPYGQQFVFASSESPGLQKGGGCVGDATSDPVGATFDQVYNGNPYYVIWNDQFYDDPTIGGCTKECGSPWGHSKGMLVWDDLGNGFVMQVSTPSWPASGSSSNPRKTDGNTLGCVKDDDVEVSQHFFASRVNQDDVVNILQALQNSSVVTDPTNPQIVNNGGPAAVQSLVKLLGTKSSSNTFIKVQLSTGVGLISKPSNLNVPPWQMVSSLLGGVPLRTATWWAKPMIPSTNVSPTSPLPGCWDSSLPNPPGSVDIATTGQWDGVTIGLKGGMGTDFNHAKLGVSTAGANHFAIFGDMNQQGVLSGSNCASSQNGRGGLFYVIDNQALADSVGNLINGATAPAD